MSMRCTLTILFLFTLSCFAGLRLPLNVTENRGPRHELANVTSGVPFPMGALTNVDEMRLVDEQDREVGLHARSTATWRDGSVKWVLLDFQHILASQRATKFFLEYGPGVHRKQLLSPLKLEDSPEAVRVTTGPLSFFIAKNRFGILEQASLTNRNPYFQPGEVISTQGLKPSLKLANEFAGKELTLQPPEKVVIEESGPFRAVIKLNGWFTADITNCLLQYIVRVHAFAGSSAVQVDFTLVQMSDTIKTLWVKDLSLNLHMPFSGQLTSLFGGEPKVHSMFGSVHLQQLQESAYTISDAVGQKESGLKSPGSFYAYDVRRRVVVGNRFFWQQFPKAITVNSDNIRIGLYPEEAAKPFDMDQGLAKTHEVYLEFVDKPIMPTEFLEKINGWKEPSFAVAPTSWYCDSKVFGDLQPFDFDLFPDYETLTEASGDQFIRKMATGFRHWGDYYYGGEYKGTNSYMNLEYDVHHNFYCQFARTGLRKYLDTAVTMAKHQADIDTNHKTGWQWKHSPRHVEIQAEFGHTFTRGLLETWYLTGNRRCFDAAIELGDYFAKQIRVPRELGNERQIGWSLISLLPVYEATWDKKYFDAAKETVDRLLAGLDEKGKFKIRWDNRIAFFNGIAATGFIYYYRATGDERVAEAAMRVIHRARGFYPEYAGRTLEAIAWAYQRSREPEDLDFLQRTWETTMARQISWNVMELGAPTIFTVHALPFMARSGFFAQTEKPFLLTPDQFDSGNGMYVHHLPSGTAELWLNNAAGESFELALIRKGAWKAPGEAMLFDPSGAIAASLKFGKEATVWQRPTISISPGRRGIYALKLKSETPLNVKGGSYITWDIATSRPVPCTFATPDFRGLEFVTPRLFSVPETGAKRIELVLSAQREGFKKAVIYDPEGDVAGSTEAFIDLGDKGRYEYKVSAEIPVGYQNRLWSISLQDVSLQKMTGLKPYFSTSQQSFFQRK